MAVGLRDVFAEGNLCPVARNAPDEIQQHAHGTGQENYEKTVQRRPTWRLVAAHPK
jgi:hypothetical protein